MLYEDEEKRVFGDEREVADEDIYSESGREDLIEDEDEITDVDEGFMRGYEEGERTAICANCKKLLGDDFIEQVFDDETYRFCSSECAHAFAEKKAL